MRDSSESITAAITHSLNRTVLRVQDPMILVQFPAISNVSGPQFGCFAQQWSWILSKGMKRGEAISEDRAHKSHDEDKVEIQNRDSRILRIVGQHAGDHPDGND